MSRAAIALLALVLTLGGYSAGPGSAREGRCKRAAIAWVDARRVELEEEREFSRARVAHVAKVQPPSGGRLRIVAASFEFPLFQRPPPSA